MAPRYLQLSDLESCVGVDRVVQYFDEDNDGAISSEIELSALDDILTAAENEADSRLKRSFSTDQITDLANNDTALKRHVAWVALTFASERRPEFLGGEGGGGFKTQYERAIKYFDSLGKGKTRSFGETEAGRSARIGGVVNPPRQYADEPRFIFARCNKAPTGHGGF